MKLLKIVFLAISILGLASCEKDDKASANRDYSEADNYVIDQVNTNYFIARADYIVFEGFGILDYLSVHRNSYTSKYLKKCKFDKDVTVLNKTQIQTKRLINYFDFYVDGVMMQPILFHKDYLRLDLPKNAQNLEVKLKTEFAGNTDLEIIKRSRSKYCFNPFFMKDIFSVGNKKADYGKYKRINKLKKLNINLKLIKGFIL